MVKSLCPRLPHRSPSRSAYATDVGPTLGFALCFLCLPESNPAMRQDAAAFLLSRSRDVGTNLSANLLSASSEMLFAVTWITLGELHQEWCYGPEYRVPCCRAEQG